MIYPPKLTLPEERELLQAAHAGSRQARDKLVLHNLRLVHHSVKKYAINQTALDELVTEGAMGVMEAVRRFSPKRGRALAPYARLWIKAYVFDHLLRMRHAVRVPHANAAGELERLFQKRRDVYLDADGAAERFVSGDGWSVEPTEAKIDVERLMRVLDERERRVVELRYLRGWDWAEVAMEFGRSRRWAEVQAIGALGKMRRAAG